MPKKAKLVVLATGDMALPAVEAIAEAGHDLLRIVAQPSGSGEDGILPEERQGSAVASFARKHKINLSRPSQPGGDRQRGELEKLAPDLGVMIAFGRRFPLALLDVPKRGWIKLHFSLLPKLRGLHPVRAALWHGLRRTGVSVIRVTEEPDAGTILLSDNLNIDSEETFGELAPRMAALAAELVLPAIAAGLRRKPAKSKEQNHKKATPTPRFGRRHRLAPWWREADVVYNRLRALSPEPGMTTLVKGTRLRILRGTPADYFDAPISDSGAFIGMRSGRMAVLCGNGTAFGIDQVQPEKGEPMSPSTFVRSSGLRVGDTLV